MNKIAKSIVLAACLTPFVSLQAQTLLTDFSSAANLGASTPLVGTAGSYDVAGNVANYTVTGSSDNEFVYRSYTGAVGSYTSDWSVQVDVNYANPSTIFTSNVSQFINIGLMIVPTGVTPGVDENGPTFNAFLVESNLYHNTSNVSSRDIRTAAFSPGLAADSTRYAIVDPLSTATATAVQISFDATTKILSAGYDANGAASGYTFLPMPALTSNASTWGMSGANTFSIYLMANSGLDDGAGFGPEIAAGGVTVDNLMGSGLTAVPEPSTYAAIAGVAALGLAVWRRKQRAVSA